MFEYLLDLFGLIAQTFGQRPVVRRGHRPDDCALRGRGGGTQFASQLTDSRTGVARRDKSVDEADAERLLEAERPQPLDIGEDRRRIEAELGDVLDRKPDGLGGGDFFSERTQQLVASQARYKALFDLVADSVFMVDANGTVVAVNKREEQALGYAESKVVGSSMHDVVVPLHRKPLAAWLAEIGTGQGQVPTQEITVYNAAGLETPVEMDLIRVAGAGQLLIMVQMRDITDRKRLERQLQTYREELEIKVSERMRSGLASQRRPPMTPPAENPSTAPLTSRSARSS